jgi:hypothetical protein
VNAPRPRENRKNVSGVAQKQTFRVYKQVKGIFLSGRAKRAAVEFGIDVEGALAAGRGACWNGPKIGLARD